MRPCSLYCFVLRRSPSHTSKPAVPRSTARPRPSRPGPPLSSDWPRGRGAVGLLLYSGSRLLASYACTIAVAQHAPAPVVSAYLGGLIGIIGTVNKNRYSQITPQGVVVIRDGLQA